jgi:hypothetical protein
MTEFGRLDPDGTYTKHGDVKQSDMLRCPHKIIMFTHYRPDGSCKCDDPTERAMMIAEWGYTESDFSMPLRNP